jgi:hypothetical protein
VAGEQPPSGLENVTASYRRGAGDTRQSRAHGPRPSEAVRGRCRRQSAGERATLLPLRSRVVTRSSYLRIASPQRSHEAACSPHSSAWHQGLFWVGSPGAAELRRQMSPHLRGRARPHTKSALRSAYSGSAIQRPSLGRVLWSSTSARYLAPTKLLCFGISNVELA